MSNKLLASLAAVAVVALLGGTLGFVMWQRAADPFAECRGSAVTGGGAIGGPFTLVGQTGKTVTDADVLAKPSLVYFGYTFCPDVCPLDNTRNAEAIDMLAAKGFTVTPVFITIDPARDTPQALAQFADAMHPSMIALTGTDEQIKTAAAAYRVYYKKGEEKDGFYSMDHSTFSYLMLPGKGFVDFFGHDESAEEIARRTACYLDKG